MIKNIGLLVALMIFMMGSVACQKVAVMPETEDEQEAVEMTAEEEVAMPSNVNVATIAINAGGRVINVNAEMAVTKHERAHGLQGRQSLPKNYGMWFIFPQETQDSFWMKDTLISLDIIFVGPDMKVVDIIENTTPQSTDLLISKVPYQHVLEVEAGFVSDNGVQIGDAVEQRVGPK